jgi:LAGLIDADG-like domain
MVEVLAKKFGARRLGRDADHAIHDLYFFGSFYLGLDLEEKPHREMCDLLMANEEETAKPYTMLVVPRDCFKCQSAEEFDEMMGRITASPEGGKIVRSERTSERGWTAPLVRVKTATGRSLDVTPNHPFKTWDGWKSLDDGLAVGAWVATVRRGVFGDVHEPDLARLVGWMIADASLRSQCVAACDPTEQDELVALAEKCGYGAVKMLDGTGVRIHKMQDRWREWGLFHAKSATKFTPDFILQGDEETVRGYLGGLFHDAGLATGRNGAVVYTSTSRRLAREVQHLLIKFGLRPLLNELENLDGRLAGIPDGYRWYTVVYTDHAGIFTQARLNGPSPSDTFPPAWRTRIPVGMGLKLREAGIRIDNDYATTREKVRRVAEFLGDEWLAALCDSDIAWEQIKSIERLPDGEIVVAESPNHTLADGDIITHNSTLAARALPIWKQLRRVHLDGNPHYRIMLISSKLHLVEGHLAAIESELRYNPKLNADFEPLWQNRTSQFPSSLGKRGITIGPRIRAASNAKATEPSFWIGSIRAARTGMHADEGIIDDLSDYENSSNPFQRAKTQKTWKLLLPILGSREGSRSRITFIGTPWHDDDVRGMVIREEKAREDADETYKSPWAILHRGAINEDGTAFFPSRYPLERLDAMRLDMTESDFNCNYLCDPVGDKGFIDEELIKFEPLARFPALRDCRITVDPNQHNEARELGCYAAIVVSGYDKWAKLWVREVRASREWDTHDLMDELFDLQEKYGYPIYMEDSHMTHFAAAVALEEAQRSQAAGHRVMLRIHYIPTDPRLGKYERARRLVPRFKNNAIVFAYEIPPKLKVELKSELIRGPETSRFKDILDALAMAETGFRPRVAKDGSFMEIDQPDSPGQEKAPEKVKMTGLLAFPDVFRRAG